MGKSIKTRTRYSICGSDFSAQEPRSTASLANDEAMLNAYKEGKDLYAVIGEQSGKKYQLGDKVTIKVLRCDKIKKTIDFSFVDDNIEGVE